MGFENGLVAIDRDTVVKSLNNYDKEDGYTNELVVKALQKAIDAVELNWWHKLWGKSKKDVFCVPMFMSYQEVLTYKGFLSNYDCRRRDIVYRWESVYCQLKSLCSVNQDNIYLSPTQARFVSKWADDTWLGK